MLLASCSATMRSSSSARCAPHAGWPRVNALCARSCVCGRWSTPGSCAPKNLRLFDHAADRDAAEADAVIAALAADQPRARAFAADAVIGQRDLERGVDRLGAGVGEEHVVEPLRQPAHDLVRELERAGMSHLERRRVVHLGDLPADRLGDLLAAVAGVDAPEAGHAVEDLAPVGRPVVHAGRLGEQPRLRLELAIGRERHPEGFEVGAVESWLDWHGG